MKTQKKNPYAGVTFTLASGAEIQDLKLGDSREAAIASDGTLNATSDKDMLGQIAKLVTASSRGEIVRKTSDTNRRMHREVLAAAFNDRTGTKWQKLGMALAAKIEESGQREGFMRNLLIEEQLNQGEVARCRMRVNNVVAVMATSAAMVLPQLVRERMMYPPEFYVDANIEVENRDIDQISSDILDEKYTEGLQAIMTTEDRLWKRAADATVGSSNFIKYIAGALTPTTLTSLRNEVAKWKIPATTCLLSYDYWNDIVGNSEFMSMLDPVTKFDLVLNGELGTLLGMRLVTDGYRAPELQVLGTGEIYIVGAQQNHGQFTTRGGVESTPIDGALQGRNTRGWFMSESLSLVIANARSVAKGQKI
jgi:hypothetical protein